MRFPMAREGWFYVMPPLLLASLALLNNWYMAAIVLGALAAALAHLFRDPVRPRDPGEVQILAPADGTVIEISSAGPMGGLTRTVSIATSIFDVHVNRAPISGKIAHYEKLDSQGEPSKTAEQALIIIEGERLRVGIRQIAGLLARHVVFDHEAGQHVAQGQRIGMIQFGSRVDVYLPEDVEVRVKVMDKVKVGITLIAEATS